MKEEQIIQSARKLFTKYGYKKVSMDEIAKEAGVTKKTIYSYFKDKNELLRYFLLEEVESMQELVDKIKSKNLPFFKTVHETIYEVIKRRKEKEFLIVLSKESENINNSSVKEALKILDTAIKEHIENMLKYGIENGYIRKCDTKIVSFIVYKVYIALIFDWDLEKEPLDEKAISRNIVDVLQRGLFIQEKQ